MSKDETAGRAIDTGGAAYVEGDVRTGGGDVVGTKNVYNAPPPRIPMQRPARAVHFTGREQELGELVTTLQPGEVVTLYGPGGIGKSALAAEAIWTLAPGDASPELFPAGIVMHNFYQQPQTAVALAAICRAYDEEPSPTLRAAARRALAGRRALLFLDGTENADDLPSLLEVRGGCGVLVTSRRRRDALAGREDLGPLPQPEAVALLQTWGGVYAGARPAAERVCQIVGGLPLAVRLAGRYLDEQQENVESYLAWLQETPLAALEHGEHREESVDVLLERSLAQVSEEAGAALGVAGILALASFGLGAARAALDVAERRARKALGELVSYGLLLRAEEGRYEVTHALIHTYARRRCTVTEESVARLAAFYVGLTSEQADLESQAFRPLYRERPHIVAVLEGCVAMEVHPGVHRLVWAVERYLRYQGHWTDLRAVLGAGLGVAQQMGDSRQEANCISALGHVHRMLSEYEAARECYEAARLIYAQIGDWLGEANCIRGLGDVHRVLAEYGLARERYEEARWIYAQIGDRYSTAVTLVFLGLVHQGLGETAQARGCLEEAVRLLEGIGSRWADWARGLLEKLPGDG